MRKAYSKRYRKQQRIRRQQRWNFAKRLIALLESSLSSIDSPTIIDYGCGLGDTLYPFLKHGWSVIGYENGLEEVAVYAEAEIVPHIKQSDLSVSLVEPVQCSVAVSTEVAEHLPESAALTFVKNIVSGDPEIVVFSAAPPGQKGRGHINCQPKEYWEALFEQVGYKVAIDSKYWNFIEEIRTEKIGTKWIRKNIMFLERQTLKRNRFFLTKNLVCLLRRTARFFRFW